MDWQILEKIYSKAEVPPTFMSCANLMAMWHHTRSPVFRGLAQSSDRLAVMIRGG